MRKGRVLRATAGLVVVILSAAIVGASAGWPAALALDDHRVSTPASPGASPASSAATASPQANHEATDVDGDHDSDDVDGAHDATDVEGDHDSDDVDGAHDATDVDGDHDSDDVDGAHDSDVGASGGCSGTATWLAEVERDDGALEFELTVHGKQANARWSVEISHNGTGFYSGDVTAGKSGAFQIERQRADTPGTDTFTFTARQGSDAQTCTGTVPI